MDNQESFDFESFKKQAISDFYSGKSATGTEGIFAPLMKHLLESMMAGELSHHLEEDKLRGVSNRKNGKTTKKVKSISAGEFELESTRDRLGTFNSNILPKRRECFLTQFRKHSHII